MVAVNYDWDELEDNIVEEYDDSGNAIAEYTTEPYLHGDLISQRRNGLSSFYCFDGLGGTLALTDPTGGATDTNAYTAFGETTEHTGNTTNHNQYVGQKGYYSDDERRVYTVRQRIYNPAQSQWLSVDPNRLSIASSGYVYASRNPLLYIDPSGESASVSRGEKGTFHACSARRLRHNCDWGAGCQIGGDRRWPRGASLCAVAMFRD